MTADSHAPARAGRRAAVTLVLARLALVLTAGPARLPATAAPQAAGPRDPDAVRTLGDSPAGLPDVDLRDVAAPTDAQRAAAAELDAEVRWNRFGTPASVTPTGRSLGAATSADPVVAAREWLGSHADLLGLTPAQVADLALVNDQRFARDDAVAVLLEQRFHGLAPALGSKVTVGVADGRVHYVSSSLTRTTGTPADARLTPVQGWLAAARDVGRDVAAGDVTASVARGWTRLEVPGFAQEQQVRLRALADADGSVRPVLEANVVDVEGGAALAYTSLVDAVTGEVLHRQDQVRHSAGTETYTGATGEASCGPRHPYELTDGSTRQIVVTTAMVNTLNDVVITLVDPSGTPVATGDLLFSPETLTYAPGGTLDQGVWNVQVCPYDVVGSPLLPPYDYAGTITSSDSEQPSTAGPLPRWRYFPANPALDWSATHTPTNDRVGCWAREEGCTVSTGPLEQPFSAPWDHDHRADLPTLTSVGNNAETREAWASPLTPGGTAQAPVSPTREYTREFTDAWNNGRCDPASLTPGGNDVVASVTNLFVGHNRMHDYSYGLGFTERNYNLQTDNLGRNTDPTRENDPEIGNAQAGAVTGGSPSYLGRDNANQITLQDGVPGITNQYLFQPIAGAFYAPCADGGLDMSIVGHEYTHAITNRMVAGPDEGLTSEHGGAMGESWGDLVGAEYLFAHGYATGTNPWAVGPYATGNRRTGIRDYAINRNPLNFSDYGFDSTGNEVHADGEIWNGVMWQVRQALVDRWDARYPYADRTLQRRCSQGDADRSPLPARHCPGNRRWLQLMFDSFLLQQGATSMVDARDAMLAADRMRFGGADQEVMWRAFARRGLGRGASTPTPDSGSTRPSFRSPREAEGTVVFRSPNGAGTAFVGRYEARVTPVADTRAGTRRGNTVRMVPGRYRFLFRSAATGTTRVTARVRADRRTVVTIGTGRNLAASANGARVLRASAGSRNPAALLDGTEATNWGGVNEDGTNVDQRSPFVAVDLAGALRTVRRVQVSAMLRPADDSDADAGSRFTALRRFALERCTSACGSADARWTRFWTSPADAFPSVRPRPVAPTLTLRRFDVPDVRARAVRLVALENQCTGFAGYAGEQDDDPLNATDCRTASDRGSIVHAAELQVYGG